MTLTRQAQAIAIARQFQLGCDIEAGLAMMALFEDLMPLVARFPPTQQHAFSGGMRALLDCQEQQDWLGVADYLWVDLQPLFKLADELDD